MEVSDKQNENGDFQIIVNTLQGQLLPSYWEMMHGKLETKPKQWV